MPRVSEARARKKAAAAAVASRKRPAQALVELALLLPVLLIMLLGMIDLGRGLVFGVSVQQGAREAARIGAAAALDTTVTDAVVLQRFIAASAPALAGCGPTLSSAQQCGGGTWTFSIKLTPPAGSPSYSSIAAKHLLEGVYAADKTKLVDNPYWSADYVGAGPYKVQSFERGGGPIILQAFDAYIVDGLVNGTAQFVLTLGRDVRHVETGKVQNYMVGFFGGVAVLAAVVFVLVTVVK